MSMLNHMQSKKILKLKLVFIFCMNFLWFNCNLALQLKKISILGAKIWCLTCRSLLWATFWFDWLIYAQHLSSIELALIGCYRRNKLYHKKPKLKRGWCKKEGMLFAMIKKAHAYAQCLGASFFLPNRRDYLVGCY